MTATLFLELLIGGVALGGQYALMAFAFSLVLATTHVLNVAHGVVLVCGAAAATLFVRQMGWPVAAALAVVAVLFAGVGALFEAALVRPLARRPASEILVGSIPMTFGLALAAESLLGYVWARRIEPQPIFALSFGLPALTIGGVAISGSRLAILAYSAIATAAAHLFLSRTRFGREARALSQNVTGALVVGIDLRRVSRGVFVLTTMATAVAGAVYAVAQPLNPYDGVRLTMIAFTVAAVGGVGNLPGALIAGVALGVAEVFTSFWAGAVWAPAATMVLLFAVLLARPDGTVGGRW
ncbi:MAG: branched-chain amino acid ABC transporter permease [Armatimonadetes bacterium]|nr:branched-chain amino acid ABC transporter permease [Armatimonadota bacterium]